MGCCVQAGTGIDYRSMFIYGAAAQAVCDVDGRLLDCTARLAQLLGYVAAVGAVSCFFCFHRRSLTRWLVTLCIARFSADRHSLAELRSKSIYSIMPPSQFTAALRCAQRCCNRLSRPRWWFSLFQFLLHGRLVAESVARPGTPVVSTLCVATTTGAMILVGGCTPALVLGVGSLKP